MSTAAALRSRFAAATPTAFRAEKMEPPKPGEKCALCGQIMPGGPEDQVVTEALSILALCKKAGLPQLASKLMQAKLPRSELQTLGALASPDLKNALVLRANASMWDEIVAEQNGERSQSRE
jgi:hypothetical protein